MTSFAPTGRLRAAINLGNPILAHRDPVSGMAGGVSVDLARQFGRELGVEVELALFEKAMLSVQAVRDGHADLGFFAVDPARSEGLAFTAPYVLIEGSYLVRDGSALQNNIEVDRAGTRVAVGQGSAYDLFLSRELKAAQVVQVANAPAVLQALKSGAVEVAAGIRQLLAGWASEHRVRDEGGAERVDGWASEHRVRDEGGAERVDGWAEDGSLRLLPGRFMVIEQAMGLRSDRGEQAAAMLADFVERMKATGFVAEALARHGIEGATIAPNRT